MKFNYINKKTITIALAGVIALTPLSACSYQTNEDGAIELVTNVSFDTLSSSRVVILKTKGDVKVYISNEHSDYSYNDILTDKTIYQINNRTEEVSSDYEGIEFICEESVMPYLLIYDYIKESYTKEDIVNLIKNIENDYYKTLIEKVKTYE